MKSLADILEMLEEGEELALNGSLNHDPTQWLAFTDGYWRHLSDYVFRDANGKIRDSYSEGDRLWRYITREEALTMIQEYLTDREPQDAEIRWLRSQIEELRKP